MFRDMGEFPEQLGQDYRGSGIAKTVKARGKGNHPNRRNSGVESWLRTMRWVRNTMFWSSALGFALSIALLVHFMLIQTNPNRGVYIYEKNQVILGIEIAMMVFAMVFFSGLFVLWTRVRKKI